MRSCWLRQVSSASVSRVESARNFLLTRCCLLRPQGVVGIECLEQNEDLAGILAHLDHDTTVLTTNAERAIAAELQAGCQSPVATYATIDDGRMTVTALAALPDGSESIRESLTGDANDELGPALAGTLKQRGAVELLSRAEAMSD